MRERLRNVYQVASALMLVALVAALVYALWSAHAARVQVLEVYGPDTDRDLVPDRMEGLLEGIEDPEQRRALALAINALADLVAPPELESRALKVAIFNYFTALDCMYLTFGGDRLTRIETAILEAMLYDETLKARYAQRVARAKEAGYIPDLYPGLLCPN